MILLSLHGDFRNLELLDLDQDGLRLYVFLVAAGTEVEREVVSVEFLTLVAEGFHMGVCGWLYYYIREGSLEVFYE